MDFHQCFTQFAARLKSVKKHTRKSPHAILSSKLILCYNLAFVHSVLPPGSLTFFLKSKFIAVICEKIDLAEVSLAMPEVEHIKSDFEFSLVGASHQ